MLSEDKHTATQQSLQPLQAPYTTAFDFTPAPTEEEPKIARAAPLANAKHGLSCQRLDKSSWYKVSGNTSVCENILAELTPN